MPSRKRPPESSATVFDAAAIVTASRAQMFAMPVAMARRSVWLSRYAACANGSRPTASGIQSALYPSFSTSLANSAVSAAAIASRKNQIPTFPISMTQVSNPPEKFEQGRGQPPHPSQEEDKGSRSRGGISVIGRDETQGEALQINLRRGAPALTVSSSAQMCSKSWLEARSIILINLARGTIPVKDETSVDPLIVRHEAPLGWLVLNRPQVRNALNLRTWQRIAEGVAELASDDAVRVIVMRGATPQAFIAGADISEFPA